MRTSALGAALLGLLLLLPACGGGESESGEAAAVEIRPGHPDWLPSDKNGELRFVSHAELDQCRALDHCWDGHRVWTGEYEDGCASGTVEVWVARAEGNLDLDWSCLVPERFWPENQPNDCDGNTDDCDGETDEEVQNPEGRPEPTRENCPDAWAVVDEPAGWSPVEGGFNGPVTFEVAEGCALIATTGNGVRLDAEPFLTGEYSFHGEMEPPRLFLSGNDWVDEYIPADAEMPQEDPSEEPEPAPGDDPNAQNRE